jgi:hypothetical protein
LRNGAASRLDPNRLPIDRAHKQRCKTLSICVSHVDELEADLIRCSDTLVEPFDPGHLRPETDRGIAWWQKVKLQPVIGLEQLV